MSAAKRRANRLNAQKSTGPRTAEGKAASSRNAITHGLFCQGLLVGDEDAAQLNAFKEDVLARMRPADAMEAELAEQYLRSAWRLKRLRRAEQRLHQSHAQSMQKNLTDASERVNAGDVLRAAMRGTPEILDKLYRYEHRFFGTMLRCMKELRVLQREEIEEEPGEATDVQNEATAPAEVNAQNEATDPPSQANPSPGQQLPAVLDMPLTPKARRLIEATEKTLQESVDLKRRMQMLGR